MFLGESLEDETLERAVRWVQAAAEFGAHRLGHAIALGIDPARYGRHVRRESGPQRRDQIRYDLAHLDGLVFDTTFAAELDWVCQHTGGGDELRRGLLETAWRSRAECLSGRLNP
jgi:hypothetical protein